MDTYGGADDGEDRVYRFSIDRLKIDGIFKETEPDDGFLNLEHQGISDMGNGNAVADTGRAQRLPGYQCLEQKWFVYMFVQGKAVHDGLQYFGFIVPWHAIQNSALPD